MKKLIGISVLLMVITLSCRKTTIQEFCFLEFQNKAVVTNSVGTVFLRGGDYFIDPDNTSTVEYLPCNLPVDLKVPGIRVTFSGNVKDVPAEPKPVAIDNIELTRIDQID